MCIIIKVASRDGILTCLNIIATVGEIIPGFITWRSEQSGHHFADAISKCNLLVRRKFYLIDGQPISHCQFNKVQSSRLLTHASSSPSVPLVGLIYVYTFQTMRWYDLTYLIWIIHHTHMHMHMYMYMYMHMHMHMHIHMYRYVCIYIYIYI